MLVGARRTKRSCIMRRGGTAMKYFDLHCDTIEELKKRGENFLNSTTQFTIQEQDRFEAAVQCMAVWVPDSIRGREAVEFTDSHLDYLEKLVEMIPDRVVLADAASDLEEGIKKGRGVLIRTIEGGAALGGDLENIMYFAQRHIKMMTLTWNGANELGSGCSETGGLTGFGKEAVKLMEENGIFIDCSHLNDEGFDDLLNITTKPFAASHSNLRSCCEVSRNLREDQFREIVRRGGLCGINLYSRFLSVPDQRGEEERELLFRHIYRMLELGGEDCIAWGTDLDGQITCDPSLSSPFGAASFGAYLTERGIPEPAVKKFCFENAYRFFRSHMQ